MCCKYDDESSTSSSSLQFETLNISNDQYYQPVINPKPRFRGLEEHQDIPIYGSKTIQHSLPAYDLWRPFFPTYLSEEKFRNLHRPKLRHYNTGPQARLRSKRPKAFPVKNLSRIIGKHQIRLRNKIISSINHGWTREEIIQKHCLIREARGLTAKQGELFLFEYMEENPPVLSQIGMAANIKNYKQPILSQLRSSSSSKKAATTEPVETDPVASKTTENSSNNKVGITQLIPHDQRAKNIYFSYPKPGSTFQVIENNMYRAPIYEHEMPSCDFLIVRTRNSFYIRSVQTIYTVGQIMPLVVIPRPTESAILKFRLDLSNFYVHKLFMESVSEPPSISFDNLVKLFPDYNMAVLKKRLSNRGALFRLNRNERLFLKGDSDYGSIPLKELRIKFTPEQYCLNMAMLAARQRLRELNYTESMINPPNDAELETEVLAAPWNTSKAVIDALSGRCYLDLRHHLVDPTGAQREGFSCVQWTKSPTHDMQVKAQQVPNRPTHNSQPAPVSLQNPLANKITREKLERLAIYQKEAGIISEVQSNVLSSREVLSSEDESEDDCDDSNLKDAVFDQQIRDLDKLVIEGQTMNEVNFEKEEEERRQMQREFLQERPKNGDSVEQDSPQKHRSQTIPSCQINIAAFKNKVLRITRTYNTDEGRIQRTEIVREPKIMLLYVKQKGGDMNKILNMSGNGQDSSKSAIASHHLSKSFTENYNSVSPHKRRKSQSLAPSEFCRVEGLCLTISKRVLNMRKLSQRQNRRSAENMSAPVNPGIVN